MQVQPYINFDGRCEEALEFYSRSLGAEVTAKMAYKDAPPSDGSEPGCGPDFTPPAEKIMHSAFRVGETTIMASDCFCSGQPKFQGISLALTTANDAEAKQRFDALADGGKVEMPLAKTFFASSFGVVVDRFGVSWMIVTQA